MKCIDRIVLIVVVCATATASAFGQAAPATPAATQPAAALPQAGQPQLGAGQANAWAQMQQQFMQQFDTDRNGQLSPQEQMLAQEAMRRYGLNFGIAPGGFAGADQFSKAFDTNGDGQLSPTEAMAAQAAFQRMRNNNGGRGGVQVRGGGGSAMPPQGMMPAQPPADAKKSKANPLVKRFDKDGDGKLNAEEKAAAQAELRKDKSKDKK